LPPINALVPYEESKSVVFKQSRDNKNIVARVKPGFKSNAGNRATTVMAPELPTKVYPSVVIPEKELTSKKGRSNNFLNDLPAQ